MTSTLFTPRHLFFRRLIITTNGRSIGHHTWDSEDLAAVRIDLRVEAREDNGKWITPQTSSCEVTANDIKSAGSAGTNAECRVGIGGSYKATYKWWFAEAAPGR